ncbi:TetR family transcriptional regulator [Actinomycetota bacterium]|nr:TetR family transcriptional regulator [Actinomycetota bacterium]
MSAKGERRREQIVTAATELLRAGGPGAVSHRAVAARAGASLSATTYYFSGLDDLLTAAGARMVEEWVAHARAVHDVVLHDAVLDDAVLHGSARPTDRDPCPGPLVLADVLADAVLPPGTDEDVRAAYEHLLVAGRVPALTRALATGRHRLDAAVADLLATLDVALPAALVVAVVDGAVVSALSEGRPVRATARSLLVPLLAPSSAPTDLR